MLLELAAYAGLGGGPKAQDPDAVLPNKAPMGMGDEAFDDARRYYEQAFNEANAWGPNAKASYADASTIARNDLDARRYQDANIARLQSIASGGPGGTAVPTAWANLASAQKNNNAVTASRAAPGGYASAARLAGNTNSAMNAQGASKIAALQSAEQMAAYQALNGSLAGMRGQDWALADEQARLKMQAGLANAGAQQSIGLANQDAYNRQMGMKRGALAGAFANDQAATNARIAEQKMLKGLADWDRDLAMQRQQRQDMQQAAILDSFSKGMGKMYEAGQAKDSSGTYASDRREKRDVRSADEALKDLYDNAFRGR